MSTKVAFTTPVSIPYAPVLRANEHILTLGSCFADEMAERLQWRGVSVCSNPFGTQYNPLSVAACLRRLLQGEVFSEEELIAYDGLYHLSLCHGSLSYPTPEQTLTAANQALQAGSKALKEADTLIITFGTAWVYEENGAVVANCHKRPTACFSRRRLSVNEIIRIWQPLLAMPELATKKKIFTLSPIRHQKDGFHDNQLSKATLLLSIDQLMTPPMEGSRQGDRRDWYFPAYEILLDELRDYRFYASDLCHPSEQAVDYIYQRFEETFFAPDECLILSEIADARRALAHRPLHPDSEQYRAFRQQAQAKWDALCARYSWLEK